MGLARQQAQSVLALSLYEDEDMINHLYMSSTLRILGLDLHVCTYNIKHLKKLILTCIINKNKNKNQ